MKKINVIFILLLLLSVSISVTAAAPLQLVTLQYPPYEYLEGNKVKGLAVEIVKETFKRMNQPIEITLLPWARAINYIEQGKADAIFTAYKTPEREQFADYSHEVLIPQTISLFVKKGQSISFDGNLKKLSSYSIGVVNKVSYGPSVDSAIKSGLLPNIQLVSTGELNFKKLLLGRMDIVVSNKYGAWNILKKLKKSDQIEELTPEIQSIPSYMAFSKKRKLSALRDKFDRTLKALKKDGTYEKIIEEYFVDSY